MAEIIDDTPDLPEVPEFDSYQCQTQRGTMPTMADPPVRPSTSNHGHSIVLGWRTLIPRWDVSKPDQKQRYLVRTDTFPQPEWAQTATTAFQQAADEWNALKLGITIVATDNPQTANFHLLFKWTTDPRDFTLAEAFFPSQPDQDVIVWSYAYKSRRPASEILRQVFLHEIGHILGLRHEFAITGDDARDLEVEEDKAVQFMESNYFSVMSYNMPPEMQQSDKDGIKAFYRLENGFKIDGYPVTDYPPQIRKMR